MVPGMTYVTYWMFGVRPSFAKATEGHSLPNNSYTDSVDAPHPFSNV